MEARRIDSATAEELGRILELRLRSEEDEDLDAEGLSRWMDYELAALEAGLDPDAPVPEIAESVAAGTKRVEKGRAA